MIQDIIEDIGTTDVLVSTNVVRDKSGESASDACLHYVQKNEHGSLINYFSLPLDTLEFRYEKEIFYDAISNRDYVTGVERDDNDDKFVGFLQLRKATEVERMIANRSLADNRGFIRHLIYHQGCNIPLTFVDLNRDWDSKPMVITFPDYVDKIENQPIDNSQHYQGENYISAACNIFRKEMEQAEHLISCINPDGKGLVDIDKSVDAFRKKLKAALETSK